MAKKIVFKVSKEMIESVCCLNNINIKQVDLVTTVKNFNERCIDFVSNNIAIKAGGRNGIRSI